MKKGFTLVELLAVIIILGLIGLIIVPSITKLLVDSRQNLYNKQVEAIVEYTRKWGVDNVDKISPTKRTYISVEDLMKDGYIEQNELKDPRNTKNNMNGCIVVDYNKLQDKYEYEYTDKACKSINNDYDLTSVDSEYVCYSFDATSATILNYDKENPNCSMDILIPGKIDGIDVEYIGNAAFVTGAEKWCYNGSVYNKIGLYDECISDDYYYDWDYQNRYIESIEFPESLKGINEWAFAGNMISSLHLIDLINLEYIGTGAFYENYINNLEFKNLPLLNSIHHEAFAYNNINFVDLTGAPNLYEIEWKAFTNNNISSLNLSGLNNFDSIGEDAFSSNILTSITIPSSVTYIGYDAFLENSISNVIIEGDDIYRFNAVWTLIGFSAELISFPEIAVQPLTLSTLSPNNFVFLNHTYYQVNVPTTGSYKLEVWGAEGNNNGGLGGYSSGRISLNSGDILYVYVGQGGQPELPAWNGGGSSFGSSYNDNGGGGGATDIRLVSGNWSDNDSLNSRIIVAGGGGGGRDISGYGGGTVGGDNATVGSGGTQSAGGIGYYGTTTNGDFGKGGWYIESDDDPGAGGGWYGGGIKRDRGGGGGSGYVLTALSYKPFGYNPNLRFYMTEEQTIAGNVTMPNPSGGTMIGKTGDGYARITYLGV
jgi:prepilin-type N-terminal cleavage/methylation domain-containing protein